MRTIFTVLSLLTFLISISAYSAEDIESRVFVNENVGRVSLSAPKTWESTERHHLRFGTTLYRFLPPENGQFDLVILVNDRDHMKMEGLVDKDLEKYIESNMADAARQSTEGKVKAKRFGANAEGVYARLTDKAPKSGEFVLFTQGVQLQNKNVVLFTLYSNDQDGSILKQVLAIVESMRFEK